jgi:putative ABC transport system permease protein
MIYSYLVGEASANASHGMPRHIRFAFRSILRTPATSAFVVLSLALGIGANTAIYSLFDQALLRPLAVDKPDEIVTLVSKGIRSGRISPSVSGGNDFTFSYPMFRDLEQKQTALRNLAAFRIVEGNFALTGKAVTAGSLMLVSGQYFETLGVVPASGRLLDRQDDQQRHPVAVLSHGYWQNRLGGDRNILNRKLIVNGQPFNVAGVLPSSFSSTTLGVAPDVFVPLSWKPEMTPGWDGTRVHEDWWLNLIGRMHSGRTREQSAAAFNQMYVPMLKAELPLFTGHRGKRWPEEYQKHRMELLPGSQSTGMIRDFLQTPMRLLLATTLMVLLIACANVANLLLARAARRGPEIMVRLAIGAGPSDIFKLMLLESLLYALAGAVGGLLVGSWVLSGFLPFLLIGGEPIAGLTSALDTRVLAFTLVLSAVTGLLFGLVPALTASRMGIASSLRSSSGQVSQPGSTGMRKILVAAQVALSLVLLISAAAFTRSLYNITHLQTGLDLDHVVSFPLSPELNGYSQPRRLALYEQVQNRLSAIPSVESVSSSTIPLLAQSRWGNSIVVEGSQEPEQHSWFNTVGPGFAATLGMKLAAGRDFTDRDNAAAPKVAIVNQTFVDRYCKGRNPIGVMFGIGFGPGVKTNLQIVGVVKNSPYGSVKDDPYPSYMIPYTQAASVEGMQFYVKFKQRADTFIPQLRQIMREIDPSLPIDPLLTLRAQADTNSSQDRMILTLAAGFAVLATILAALGLYGVMTFAVAARTREIGLRLALGAELGSIREMIMRDAVYLWGAGAAVGLPVAYIALRYVQSLLFGVKASEATLFAVPVIVLGVVGLIAAFLPARRASMVDPLVALRQE